ncbi:transposase [Spirochaetia bacterium]|nr:transposase [Spirochaetia bacterium]
METAAAIGDEIKNYILRIENENKELKRTTKQYNERVIALEAENQRLEEKLRLALYRQFGRASERFIGKGQQSLFGNEEIPEGKAEPPEPAGTPVKAHIRNAKGRKPIDPKIPRVAIPVDIPEADKQCACGHPLVCIGEDITERLVIIPEQVYVEQYHIKKYACHHCEGSGDEDKPAVRTGKAPETIMPGSIATAGLLSYIFVKKYADYVPYYRQEAGFERIGVNISRQDMSNWQMKTGKRLEPLIEKLKTHVKSGEVMQMDETPMEVMREPGRNNTSKSYMWLARGGPPDKPALFYEYHETRASENVLPFLEGFKGYLQTDGWGSYHTALKGYPDVVHVGCFAHARRKFFEAMKAAEAAGAQKTCGAAEAVSYIKGLYTVEKDLREKVKAHVISQEEFLEERFLKCTPIIVSFHKWLETQSEEVLPSSALGAAIKYTLNQWPTLIKYLCHEELTPDNNAAERGIRPFVMGRKNWVMCGSPEGAKTACTLYSLIETAKANNLNPYRYLKTVFEKVPTLVPGDDWGQLLPWNITL